MDAELVVEAGRDPGRRYVLQPGQRLVLGRGDDVEVPVVDPKASRHHAAVELTAEGLTVTDLESKNGTLLDGARLPPSQPRQITDGRIRIGAHILRARLSSAQPRVRDEYEKLAELGRGAHGVVFAARHRTTGRQVAIKTLLERVDGSLTGERFLREGQVRIDSPHVVQVHDVRIEDAQVFIIMELAPGGSLQQRIDREGPLPLAHALRLGEGIALGLAAAHAAGVIHRDVKPLNVLLDAQGQAKITDFGIAKLLHTSRSLTATGTGMGTLAYVAPEQAADAKRVSVQSDLYSLGATLYHMLAGRPPFLPGPKVIEQILEDDPPPIRRLRTDCPAEVARLVRRLLEKDPEDRPATANAVAGEFHTLRA